MTIVTFVIS